MSDNPRISGILVQLPMPRHINDENILNHIPPEKDADGAHPFNMGCLAMKGRTPYFIPCTPQATRVLLLHSLNMKSPTPHAF